MLKAAAPPSLKVSEPRNRLPRVALRYLRSALSAEDLIEELHNVNLSDDPEWDLDKVKASCKVSYKRSYGPNQNGHA